MAAQKTRVGISDVPDEEIESLPLLSGHFYRYGWEAVPFNALEGLKEIYVYRKQNFELRIDLVIKAARIFIRNPDYFKLGDGKSFMLIYPLNTVEDLAVLDIVLSKIVSELMVLKPFEPVTQPREVYAADNDLENTIN